MIAVAVVACRRAEVAAIEQCTAMHAGLEFLQLACRQRFAVRSQVARHVLVVGVAAAAGVGDPLRVHR